MIRMLNLVTKAMLLWLCVLPAYAFGVGDIIGPKWLITSTYDKTINFNNFTGDKPSFVFNADNTYSAYGGCNRITGGYTLTETQLTFSDNPASTKMYCTDAFNIETNVLAILQEVVSWSYTNGVLNFINEQQLIIATLQQNPNQSNPN